MRKTLLIISGVTRGKTNSEDINLVINILYCSTAPQENTGGMEKRKEIKKGGRRGYFMVSGTNYIIKQGCILIKGQRVLRVSSPAFFQPSTPRGDA